MLLLALQYLTSIHALHALRVRPSPATLPHSAQHSTWTMSLSLPLSYSRHLYSQMHSTRLTAIFARDILLYYSYRRFYVALAQKLFRYSSCHHGVGAATAYTMVCGAAAPQVSTSMSPPHTWRRYVRLVWSSSCHSLQNTITMVQLFFVTFLIV
jgi:hypothetical protein